MRILIPNKGFASNPLRAHRNVACPCGSNLKAKRCHGRHDFLPISDIEKIKTYLRALSAKGIIEARKGEIA